MVLRPVVDILGSNCESIIVLTITIPSYSQENVPRRCTPGIRGGMAAYIVMLSC